MNAFNKAVYQRGRWATIMQAKKLGIDFIDCYVAMFGRMPRIV